MHTLTNRLARAAAMALTVSAASAHEFWVMPSAFTLEPGSLLQVGLHHGERFAGEAVARNTPQIERFEFVSGGETTPVRGLHGQTTSLLRPERSGVVVYESAEYLNVLPGAQFEAYLAEEGLGVISAWRRERGETDSQGREAYVRCAKSLITVEPSSKGSGDEVVGLPFEILLSERGSGSVSATILFDGRPLEGARVVAVHADDAGSLIELESDPSGRVEFTPGDPGVWMLTSLHMVHESARDDIEWKSYWASLTFEVGAGTTTD